MRRRPRQPRRTCPVLRSAARPRPLARARAQNRPRRARLVPAQVLYAQNKLEEAEPLFREALAGCQEILGDEHPNTTLILNNLAGLLHKRVSGRGTRPSARPLGKGEPRHEEEEGALLTDPPPSLCPFPARNLRQGSLNEAHRCGGPGRRALTCQRAVPSVSCLTRLTGRAPLSVPCTRLYWAALRISRSTLGADHGNTLTFMNNVAVRSAPCLPTKSSPGGGNERCTYRAPFLARAGRAEGPRQG